MTLILGAVCDDGVILAADRKLVSDNGKKTRYDLNKIHRVGSIAFAIAGRGYFEATIEALSNKIKDWLTFNPAIHLGIIADELCSHAEEFLLTHEADYQIILSQ